MNTTTTTMATTMATTIATTMTLATKKKGRFVVVVVVILGTKMGTPTIAQASSKAVIQKLNLSNTHLLFFSLHLSLHLSPSHCTSLCLSPQTSPQTPMRCSTDYVPVSESDKQEMKVETAAAALQVGFISHYY
jgi:hypothetical protein